MKFIRRLFKLEENKTNIRTEIIAGIITFIAMAYILPVNASILSDMGMSQAGVFAMTAFVTCLVTLIMGLVANYPIVLSAGMGLNAFLAYTLSSSLGFESWQQKMILLTIAGLIFFLFSLTPIRKKIIEAIPANLRHAISAALGAFIAFVGLQGAGVIVADGATLVTLGSLADPAVVIALMSILLCLGLMFVKKPIVKRLAIPISIAFAAVLGLIVSEVLIHSGGLIETDGVWTYNTGISIIDNSAVNIPITSWHANIKFGLSGVEDVLLYGIFSDSYSGTNLGNDLVHIISMPTTYIAIFSLIFVNLFDTTATLIAVGDKTGIIDKNGKMKNYQKAVLADAAGALICGPLGTSTVTSFVESNVGVSYGGRTGLMAVTSATFFLLSAFIYPIFSFFTAGCITAAALVGVGLVIISGALRDFERGDLISVFTALITIIFALLSYSISTGISIGLLSYVVMMLINKKGKQITAPIYIITIFSLIATFLQAWLPMLGR